jgi:hypothetical protein
MARNRVIYQSEALFVKEKDQHHRLSADDQLLRVQDISHGVEINRTDINEFGQLTAIERKVVEPPTVNLDFSYYAHGGHNEKNLGFKFTTDRDTESAEELKQALSGFMTAASDDKNYYISVASYGDDNNELSAGDQEGVIGIGNGSVTSYSLEAAVGDIATCSVSVEASNIVFQSSGENIANPSLNSGTGATLYPQFEDDGTTYKTDAGNLANFPAGSLAGQKANDYDVACVRPGDIIINFNDAGNAGAKDSDSVSGNAVAMGGAYMETDSSCHIQSFTLDVPMSRTPLNRIGSVFPYGRELDTPMTITLSVSALMSDLADGALANLLCSDAEQRNVRITLRQPCSADEADGRDADDEKGTEIVQEYLIKGLSLDSQNFSSSIGDNKTVDLVFSTQQGGANGTGNGLYMWKTDTLDYAIGEDPKVYGQDTANPLNG